MGESLEYNPHDDPHKQELWQETRHWLEGSQEHLMEFNRNENEDHWNIKATGYAAQQAVEHAMKGVLTAHNDDSRFRHDLSRMWDHVDTHPPWRVDDQGQRGRDAVRELLEYVTYPNQDKPGEIFNWLTAYAEGYRYEIVPRERSRNERKTLQSMVNEAVAALQDEALHQSGAVPENLFPNGKPWEK